MLEKFGQTIKRPGIRRLVKNEILDYGWLWYVGGRLARHLASSDHEVFIGSRTFKAEPTG